MALSLIPRKLKFFDMFDEAADLRAPGRRPAVRDGFRLRPPRGAGLRDPPGQDRHCADRRYPRVVAAINESFITPFDRENIHALPTPSTTSSTPSRRRPTASRSSTSTAPPRRRCCWRAVCPVPDCSGHVADVLRLCRDWKNAEQVLRHVREVTRLEGEVDSWPPANCHWALFANPPDPVQLIKWRELYEVGSSSCSSSWRR